MGLGAWAGRRKSGRIGCTGFAGACYSVAGAEVSDFTASASHTICRGGRELRPYNQKGLMGV